MAHLSLGGGSEFDSIRTILDQLGDLAVGIGDDTATVADGQGTLVMSTDTSVEKVHFRRDWMSDEEIGWRATAAALSDLAAAAAAPSGVMLALTLPHGMTDAELRSLINGVGGATRSAGARIIGGDLVTADHLALTVTVIGRAPRPVSRRGARPGDEVWVSGVLGGSRAALLDWLDGVTPSGGARSAFARPQSRHRLAMWLASQGATAMMDLSDGLAGDAPHLAAASGVRIAVDLAALPIHPSVHKVAERKGEDARELAATGGEDYELLFTLPAGSPAGALSEPATGQPVVRIGVVTEGEGAEFRLSGRLVTLQGYRHQR